MVNIYSSNTWMYLYVGHIKVYGNESILEGDWNSRFDKYLGVSTEVRKSLKSLKNRSYAKKPDF